MDYNGGNGNPPQWTGTGRQGNAPQQGGFAPQGNAPQRSDYPMQGNAPQQGGYAPQGEPYRRTAGGSGTGTDGMRDWQKDTWYGPAPVYGNPFDEPEDAPELRESRSENVNEHRGEFWNQQTGGYTFTGAQPPAGGERTRRAGDGNAQAADTDRAAGSGAQTREKKPISMAKALLILAAVIAVIWAGLRFTIFSVREIRIDGNSTLSDEEILQISGMHLGDSLLGLDDKTVEQRINADYRLQFGYLEKKIPSQVTLKVREREACCWLTYGGILYTMDKNRMIMYETEDLSTRPAELVEVKGLKIRSGCRTGQTLTLNDRNQETVISGLFLEMKVLGCTRLIQEVDMSSTASLIMVTRDGYTVTMGDALNLHAKLRSTMLVREKLIEMGLKGGTINVINPESPLYSPSAVQAPSAKETGISILSRKNGLPANQS